MGGGRLKDWQPKGPTVTKVVSGADQRSPDRIFSAQKSEILEDADSRSRKKLDKYMHDEGPRTSENAPAPRCRKDIVWQLLCHSTEPDSRSVKGLDKYTTSEGVPFKNVLAELNSLPFMYTKGSCAGHPEGLPNEEELQRMREVEIPANFQAIRSKMKMTKNGRPQAYSDSMDLTELMRFWTENIAIIGYFFDFEAETVPKELERFWRERCKEIMRELETVKIPENYELFEEKLRNYDRMHYGNGGGLVFVLDANSEDGRRFLSEILRLDLFGDHGRESIEVLMAAFPGCILLEPLQMERKSLEWVQKGPNSRVRGRSLTRHYILGTDYPALPGGIEHYSPEKVFEDIDAVFGTDRPLEFAFSFKCTSFQDRDRFWNEVKGIADKIFYAKDAEGNLLCHNDECREKVTSEQQYCKCGCFLHAKHEDGKPMFRSELESH